MNNDLKLALDSLRAKVSSYTELYGYYEGHPALKFSTSRLERAFGKSFVYFGQNWGGVIVNAVLDRLVLKGFNAKDSAVSETLNEMFTRLNLNLDAQDVHEALQVTGEGYLIVDVVDGEPEVYFNDPRMVEVFYDSERPKLKRFAAKRWIGDDGKYYMALYYTDRTEVYISDKGKEASSYSLVDTAPNAFNVIPVFHFRNSRRVTKGEFDASTISILDAINKLFGDLMVSAEFEAFKMRIFISQADPGDVKIGPDMKMWLPANESSTGQDTSIQEIGGSDLKNFLESIESLASTLAITTRTPRHMFQNTGANTSGEALIVEESGLVKKVKNKEEAYSPTWSEVAQYLLKVIGVEVSRDEIIPVWDDPATTQPLTKAQTLQAHVTAGIPLESAMKLMGYDETQLEEIRNN